MKANWSVGLAIGVVSYAAGEYYGDIAQKYDTLEALIKSVNTNGVYIKTEEMTSWGIRSTLTTTTVSVYTYEGVLIGAMGY